MGVLGFWPFYQGQHQYRQKNKVGKGGHQQRKARKPTQRKSAAKAAKHKNNKAGYEHQRSVNDADARVANGGYNGGQHVAVVGGKFLPVVYQKPDGDVDGNAQRHAKHQNGGRFERYTSPTHNAGRNHKGNNVGDKRAQQNTPGSKQQQHADADQQKSPQNAVFQATDQKLAAF